MNHRTLEQERAKHAWDCIEKLNKENKEYRQEAKKLPVRIMASGLGQALAFIHAKSKDKKKGLNQLKVDLTAWVITKRLSAEAQKKEGDLLQNILEGDSDFLRRATHETLAWLQWLNRFTEAKFGMED